MVIEHETGGTPGWRDLATRLFSLHPTGPEGFEGLVAGWLGHLLSEDFFIAASGRQRLGDAASRSLEVGIQAKLYGGSSRPRVVEILGDVATLAANLRQLQVYVLASTANLDLDRYLEIDLACSKEGIDLVFLAMSREAPSDLGALAVTFWTEVTSRWVAASAAFAAWAETAAQTPPVAELLTDLRRRLTLSIDSQRRVTLRSRDRVLARLFPSAPHRRFGTSIDSARLVQRGAIETSLNDWWASAAGPLLVIGEEGLGKSWAVAAWLRARAAALPVPVVWLDSHRWQNVQGLDDLARRIALNLAHDDPPRQEEEQRLFRKLVGRWPPPACLVVLDGANEGTAPGATDRILKEYFDAQGSVLAERFRLVVTARPTEAWLRGDLRERCTLLRVPLLTPEELDEAVRKASGGRMGADALPGPLRELARRPRYLELAFELRERLGDFAEVTIESVLFARLRRLLENKADSLGVSRGLDAIADLIRVTSPQAGLRVLEDEADRLLPHGASALRDLEDIGWIGEIEGGRRVLTATHVRLAWALFFLRRAARQRLDASVTQRIEELRAVQDPGLDDDLRSGSLGTALELIASGLAGPRAFAAAAILGAWVLSHNLRLEGPTFAAILDQEPDAYCAAVEALVALGGELPWSEQLSAPLADAWRRGGATAEALREHLVRWLLLVWDPTSERGERVTYQGVDLPRVDSWRVLQLERLAIGVLAQRPDEGLLPALCRQAGSWNLSRDERGMPYKDPIEWAGALMRWGFAEGSLVALERIATDPRSVPFEVAGAKRLAVALRQRHLATSLRVEPGSKRGSWPRGVAKEIRSLRTGQAGLLAALEPRLMGSRHWPEEIAALAADPSVPDLGAPDLAALAAGLENLAQDHQLFEGPAPGNPDLALAAWLPWLARLDPGAWAGLLSRLIDKALDYRDPHYLMGHLPALLPWPAEGAISKRLPKRIQAVAAASTATTGEDAKHHLYYLVQLAIPLADRGAWYRCLRALSRHRDASHVINLLPVPWLLQLTVDEALFEEAGRQIEKARRGPARRFWLHLAAAYAWTRSPEERLAWFSRVAELASDSEPTARLLLDFLLDVDHSAALSIAADHPALRSLLDDPYFRLEAASWARWATRVDLPDSYETLLESFPIQSVGAWLLGAGRAAELPRWGRDLLAAMTALADHDKTHAGREAWVEWSHGSVRRRARLASGEIFESDCALRAWARQEPGDFRELLAGFVAQLRPSHHHDRDLAGFAETAAMAWMEVEPSSAYAWLETFEDEAHYSPTTNGVPSAMYHLWDLTVCHGPAHQELRSHLLGTARSDFEIAAHVLSARMHGALAELDRIADPLRTSSAQLDRALAVSILAWHPRGESKLRRLQGRDPSLWVREHAGWALRVCQRDRIGRKVYRLALGATDVLDRQAKLQQLAPLLMPTFHVWRIEDRSLHELESRVVGRERALLLHFKHEATRLDLSRISLFGRDLPKYCRGEDLSRYSAGLGRQLLPWW